MENVIRLLMVLSAFCFVLGVVLALAGYALMGVEAEGFSNGCTNLALIAIALLLYTNKKQGN